MTERELIKLLNKAKDLPQFGGGFDASVETPKMWARIAGELGFDPVMKHRVYTWQEWAQFYVHKFGGMFRHSFAYGLSVFALMFGGWVATVNASFDSVPGDTLYPVKLATEKMQITLATSTERRAKLHTEFAGRRLQEVNEISVSDRGDKDARIKEAVASFKTELASAGDQLAVLTDGNSTEVAAVAAAIEQKTNEYASTLTQAELGDNSKDDVDSAKEDVERTDAQAIDALVVVHESDTAEPSREALERSFRQDFQSVKDRLSLSLGRLSTVERVLTNLGRIEASEYRGRINKAREVIVGHDRTLGGSQDYAAAGGYRRAFDLLRIVSTDVKVSEEIIAALEIEITTSVATQEEVADATDGNPTSPPLGEGEERVQPASF